MFALYSNAYAMVYELKASAVFLWWVGNFICFILQKDKMRQKDHQKSFQKTVVNPGL